MMLNLLRTAILSGFCLVLSLSANAQVETLAIQNFDSASPSWNYSSDVAFFGSPADSAGYFGVFPNADASDLDFANFSGNILAENDLDDNNDNPEIGTSDFANISFDDVNINGSENVTLSFDYQIVNYNASSDDAKYEVFYDGASQGEVFLVDGGVDLEDASGTVSISVPDNVNTLSLVVSLRNDGLDGYSGFDNFKVEGTEPNSIVSVSNNFFNVAEDNGDYNITLNVQAPDDTQDILVDIDYVSGNTDLIDNFTSTTVTIPAGSSSGTFSLPRAEDGVCTGTEEVVLEITSVSGGSNAQIGSPSAFTVSFTDNQTEYSTIVSDNFEGGDLSSWVNTQNWVVTEDNPISGNNSLSHDPTSNNGGYQHISRNISTELENATTTWQANLRETFGVTGTSNQNWIFFALTCSGDDPFDAGTQGYAVGVNFDTTNDTLKLIRFNDGLLANNDFEELVTSTYTFDDSDNPVGVRVIRDESGNWDFYYQLGGGFNNMTHAGSALDNTYTDASYLSLGGEISSNNQSGNIQFDNVLMTQESCSSTYYSVASGNSSDAIWSTDENSDPGDGFPLNSTQFDRITIQDGHTVTLNEDFRASDFTVDPGGTFELNGFELRVYKDLISTGTFDGTTGTLSFRGNENQVVITNPAVRVQNLVLQTNEADVNIASGSNLEVTGLFSPVSGTISTGTNPARLLLVSDASGTASIGEFQPEANINGNVKAQRYIPASEDGWLNLSSILTGVTVQQWDDNFITSGYGDSDYPDYNFPNIRYYDETVDGDINQGLFPITSNAENIPVDLGYFVYMLGDAITVEVEGGVHSGPRDVNVPYTGNYGQDTDGWNLVANPYPSAIDFDELYASSDGITPVFSVYSAASESYVEYNVNTSPASANNIIAAGQAFWVKSDGSTGDGTLKFRENQKVGPYSDFQRSSDDIPPLVQLSISSDGSDMADFTQVSLVDESTLDYDSNWDGFKLGSMSDEAPVISTISQDDYNLSFNAVPTDEGALEIPVHVFIPLAGTYNLTVSDMENFPGSSCISIEDLETGDIIPVEEGETLTLSTEEAIDEVRYMIHISSLASEKSDASCFGTSDGTAMVQGNGEGPWTYTWYDEMGNIIAQEENISTASEVEGLAFGTYFVDVEDDNSICGTLTKTIEIDEPMQEELNLTDFTATCNDANGQLVVEVENASGFDYTVTSDSGDKIYGTHNSDSLNLTNLPGGLYTVTITSACNSFEQITVDLTDENEVTAAIELENDVVELQDGVAEVQFAHSSENATSVVWDFGNGETSELDNPVHTFTEVGEYEVSLTAQNEICESTDTRTVTIEEIISVDDNIDPSEEISMIALQERVQLDFGNARLVQPIVAVYNSLGQQVITKKLSNVNGEVILIETSGLSSGAYTLTILENDFRVFSEQFVR